MKAARRIAGWRVRRPDLLLAAAIGLSLLIGVDASAARRVVLMPFSGHRAGSARAAVARALRGRLRLVPLSTFRGVSRLSGAVGAARALRVNAIVQGAIARADGRWTLHLTVVSGRDRHRMASTTFALRGTRVDAPTARRVASTIVDSVGRTRGHPGRAASSRSPRAPAPVPVPAPAPAPAPVYPSAPTYAPYPVAPPTAAELGFQNNDVGFVAGPDDTRSRSGYASRARTSRRSRLARRSTRHRIRARRGPRRSWERIVELAAGVLLLRRTFSINEPVKPPNPQTYQTPGVMAAISLEGALYPGAASADGFWANVGLSGRYYRAIGIKSQIQGAAQSTDTVVQEYELGLRYRWNLFGRASSPVLRFGVDFGQLAFAIGDPLNIIELPSVTYTYAKLAALDIKLPLYHKRDVAFGLSGTANYLWVFSAGDIENTSGGGYGDSFTGGVDFSAGLYASYGGLFAQARGLYRRIFFAFDDACMRTNAECNYAGGALDIFIGAAIHAGYAY